MRKYWPAVFVVTVAAAFPTRAIAQEQAGAAKAAATADASVGTAIADRALSGSAESFSASVGKLYCFSRIENATDSDIEHVWYRDSTEVARVKLHVGGSPWRTHSSKNLGENPAGSWRCDIVQDGKVLTSVAFKVE